MAAATLVLLVGFVVSLKMALRVKYARFCSLRDAFWRAADEHDLALQRRLYAEAKEELRWHEQRPWFWMVRPETGGTETKAGASAGESQ